MEKGSIGIREFTCYQGISHATTHFYVFSRVFASFHANSRGNYAKIGISFILFGLKKQ